MLAVLILLIALLGWGAYRLRGEQTPLAILLLIVAILLAVLVVGGVFRWW